MVKTNYKIRSAKELLKAIQNRIKYQKNVTLQKQPEDLDEEDGIIDYSIFSFMPQPPIVTDVVLTVTTDQFPIANGLIGDVSLLVKEG